MKKVIFTSVLFCTALMIFLTSCGESDIFADGIINYSNDEYGFIITLPISWDGYAIITEEWYGYHENDIIQTGSEIIIRNPTWAEDEIYQDIPIMVFTHDQWEQVGDDGGFHVSAGGSPSEIGRNSEYVFALRPRYDHIDARGVEEVRNIIKNEGFYSNKNNSKEDEDVNYG